jgi:cell division protein FtsL
MERSRQLFRDYGLTLALLLAAVLIYSTTTLPALALNRQRDRAHLDLLDQQQRVRDEIERLEAQESAITDPIEIERIHRELFGTLGMPKNEVLVPVAPEGAPSDGASRSGG